MIALSKIYGKRKKELFTLKSHLCGYAKWLYWQGWTVFLVVYEKSSISSDIGILKL